jgi:hypothetical protein
MKKLAFLLCLLSAPALAQQPVYTIAAPRNSVNASGTIAVTNTFQQVFAAANVTPGGSPARLGCLVQNNGTHTMYVFFGPIASATLTNSVQLAAGGSVSCSALSGVVAADQVSITGTSGDTYFAAQQ